MSTEIIAMFWVVSFLLIITPGMDWAYAISAGIRGKVVIPAVGGMLLGHMAAILLVAAGVGALMMQLPILLNTLTVLGGAYLLWLGVALIRNPASPASAASNTPDSTRQWLLKGAGISGLNPKVLLLFLALLPQFSDAQSNWPLPAQMLTLGGIHLLSCAVVYLVVGYGAQWVLQTRPAAARLVSRISGTAMAGIALLLLAEPVIQSI